MAYYFPGSSRDRQSRAAVLSNSDRYLDGPLPLRSNAGEVAPVGKSTDATALPAKAYPRSRDYTYEYNATAPYLIGQDAMNAGEQSYELPPKARPRSVDYSYIDPTEIWLIGQDAVNPGQQTYALPEPAYPRARDYTFVHDADIQLFGQDFMVPGKQTEVPAPPPRARAASYDTPYNLTVWLDLAGVPAAPVGKSTDATALPDRAYSRARDYSYTDWTFIGLIGTDAMVTGQQTYALPTPRAPRLPDYTWLQAFELPVFQEIPEGQQTYALPEPAYPRARDYTFIHEVDVNLIGTDFMVPGEQSIGTGRPTPRAADFSTPYNLTVVLDFYAQQVIPQGKTTDPTALPAKPYGRARDYTYEQLVFGGLIGTDAMVIGEQTYALPTPNRPRCASFDPGVNYTLALDAAQQATIFPAGAQTTSLPPARAPRLPDYTQLDRLPNLIGQDSMVVGKSTDATALPPKGPQRARDYTWLQSYPLHIYESLPPGDTTAPTALPPAAYRRMRDYTFLHDSDTQLIGQDSMVTGQPWLDTDNLFPRAYPRMRDYSSLVILNIAALAELTHPGHHTVTDSAEFIHTLSDRAKYAHTLTDRSKYVHTVTEIA